MHNTKVTLQQIPSLMPVCCSDSPCPCLYSTIVAFGATIAVSSNESRGGNLHCSRRVQCRPRLESHWVEVQTAEEVLKRNPCQQSCNSRFLWRLSSPSPIATATHCSQHCNQTDMETL